MSLEWLDRCYQNRDCRLLFLRVDPPMGPIRSEPRVQAVVNKLGMGQEGH